MLAGGNTYFRVIGVIKPRSPVAEGSEMADGTLLDVGNCMYVPLETGKCYCGDILISVGTGGEEYLKAVLHEVSVKVNRREEVVHVSQAFKALLDRKHKKVDYRTIVPLEQVRQAEETNRLFNMVLRSIAAISLLVGGIVGGVFGIYPTLRGEHEPGRGLTA
ncbi:MAG: hypothetical protein JW741_18200 [Sedimentisphaerales bacterium]|nr:hypothetical protein [Sedimentisphaerales bacterium]